VRQRVATALTGQLDNWPYTLHSIYPGLLEAYASMYRLQTGFSCISAAMGLVDRINVRGTMNDDSTVDPSSSLKSIVLMPTGTSTLFFVLDGHAYRRVYRIHSDLMI